MDSNNVQDSDTAARQRFRSFKMGVSAPPLALHTSSRHSHGRSRSRNNSISSFPPLSLSSSAPALSPSAPDLPPSNADASLHPPSTRPTSHHRRRSSVSTRHESAELMGVSLPDLPTAHSDDNFNLGERDSIRRRALWALEGKPDFSFTRVEIPDISSPDITIAPSDFPTKPSFPPGSGINTFVPKRDSFGKIFGTTSASKDQLGTLVEEEEEEEEEGDQSPADPVEEHEESQQAVMALPAKITSRHRPASLNLRPLSLVQGGIVSYVPGSLPTPLTPSTRPHPRQSIATVAHGGAVLPSADVPLSSASISVSQTPTRRFSYTISGSTVSPHDHDKKRCSSISYKRSTDSIPRDICPLPTPEMTPLERKFSFVTDQESLIESPLSVVDQHFLFRSHNVLLSRITELERTLRNRAPPSRHLSYASDTSAASSEPNDEMLRLISDLKTERDELKRDVDGWRQRVADADKQAGMLAKRIESERREAWVARTRLGLLEVEKSGLEKLVEVKDAALSRSMAENAVLMRERDELKDEVMKLNARLKDVDAALDECTRLRGALEQECARRKELEKLLDDAGLLNTPKLPHAVNGSWRRPIFPAKPAGMRPRGLGFQSIDSEGSTTDVESVDDSYTKVEITLDAVAEEETELSDEDNGLAGYEDEEDSDLGFSSPGGSSIGSADELDIKPKAPALDHLVRPSLPPTQSIHKSRASLSKTWTFPRGKTVSLVKQDDEVDRFFGCLDDADRSPPPSEDMNQGSFSSAFRSMSDDDELPPFVLPSDVGVVVESASSRNNDIVSEEDEKDGTADLKDDELIGEVVEGGIRFTFNIPPIICVTPPNVCITPPPEIRITPVDTCMTTPAVRPRVDDSPCSKPISILEPVEDDEDESSLTFVFPPLVQPRDVDHVTPPPHPSPPTSSGVSDPSSRYNSPPSSIPRAISLRSMSPKTPSIMFTPSKIAPGRFTAPLAYSTPHSKNVSSIPQPVSLSKLCSTSTKAQTSCISSKHSHSGIPNGSTFKPHSKVFMTNDSMSALRCPGSTQGGGAPSRVNCCDNPNSSLNMCEYSHAQDTSSLSFIMSNPLAARLPFQKLSNFIPFSWAPGAPADASHIDPSGSGSPSVEGADTTSLSGIDDGTTHPAQWRFVPRARQLEKLRSRFSLEKRNGMTPCSAVSACKGCGPGNVYL